MISDSCTWPADHPVCAARLYRTLAASRPWPLSAILLYRRIMQTHAAVSDNLHFKGWTNNYFKNLHFKHSLQTYISNVTATAVSQTVRQGVLAFWTCPGRRTTLEDGGESGEDRRTPSTSELH